MSPQDVKTFTRTAVTIIVLVVAVVLLFMVFIYAGNRVDWEGNGRLSAREEAVRDAARPCPGGRAAAVDVQRDDGAYDVKIRCAP